LHGFFFRPHSVCLSFVRMLLVVCAYVVYIFVCLLVVLRGCWWLRWFSWLRGLPLSPPGRRPLKSGVHPPLRSLRSLPGGIRPYNILFPPLGVVGGVRGCSLLVVLPCRACRSALLNAAGCGSAGLPSFSSASPYSSAAFSPSTLPRYARPRSYIYIYACPSPLPRCAWPLLYIHIYIIIYLACKGRHDRKGTVNAYEKKI
jgi:hypothetical protein